MIVGVLAQDGLASSLWLEREIHRILLQQYPVVGLTAIRGDVDVAFLEIVHSLQEPCSVIKEATRSPFLSREEELRILGRTSTLVTLIETTYEQYVIEQSDVIVVVQAGRRGGEGIAPRLVRAARRGAIVLVLDVENQERSEPRLDDDVT